MDAYSKRKQLTLEFAIPSLEIRWGEDNMMTWKFGTGSMETGPYVCTYVRTSI